jgi:MSHA biogenesis protein MshP
MSAAQQGRKRQAAGFALMMAIFIIVTLAALGVYVLTISTGQLEAATQDEQGARAYQAAHTGIDWGAFQLLCNPSNPNCSRPASPFFSGCTGGGGSSSQTLTLGQGLSGFCAQVNCQRVGSESEGGIVVAVYRITATGFNRVPPAAACGAGSVGPTYVERQLQLTLTR